MTTQLTRQIHNPQNLTSEQYGAKDGWRLLYVGEDKPVDCEYWVGVRWLRALAATQPEPDTTYRTKHPDPFGDGWIEMSDRKPKDADFPVWNGFFQLGIFWCRTANRPGEIAQCAAYWKPAKNDIPAPPVVKLTQEQQDEAALVQYDKMQWPSGEVTPHQRQMWHAALAYERARMKGTP